MCTAGEAEEESGWWGRASWLALTSEQSRLVVAGWHSIGYRGISSRDSIDSSRSNCTLSSGVQASNAEQQYPDASMGGCWANVLLLQG